VGHAEIDAAAQRSDRASAIAAVDIPGALPDHGYLWTVLAEFLLSQDYLQRFRIPVIASQRVARMRVR